MLAITRNEEVARMFAKKMEMCCRTRMCMQMCMRFSVPSVCCRGIR